MAAPAFCMCPSSYQAWPPVLSPQPGILWTCSESGDYLHCECPGFQRNLQTLANSLASKGVISRLLQGPEQNSSIPYCRSTCESVQCSLLLSPRMSSLVCPSPAPQSSAPTFSQTESFNLPGSEGSLRAQTLGWLPLSQNCSALLPGHWLEQVSTFSSRASIKIASI